jgi:hypothetical protein
MRAASVAGHANSSSTSACDDGREVKTAKALPRPEADGVELRTVGHKEQP